MHPNQVRKFLLLSVVVTNVIWGLIPGLFKLDWSLIPGLFKLDTMSPTARHLCNVSPPWFEAVLTVRLAAEMSHATRHIPVLSRNTR